MDNPSGAYLPNVHYDLDVESGLLGVCLVEPGAYGKVKGLVEVEHFYDRDHGVVFLAIEQIYLSGEVVDHLTVNHLLRKQGIFELKGTPVPYTLTQFTNGVFSAAHIERWALILRELYVDRELIRISHEASAGDGDPLDKAIHIQETIQKALNLKSTDDWRDMSVVMLALDKHREKVRDKQLMGVPTGISTLDKLIYGLQPGQLIVIAARPSVGKTAFAAGLAIYAAKKEFKIGIVSLEMPEEQIGGRLAALYADIEFWKVYRNKHSDADEEKRLMQAMADMAGLPISLSSKTNVSGSDIRAKAEKLKRRKGLDMLLIDYLQLIEGEGKASDNREREVAKLSRSLKTLGMQLGIPVVILCQLNRESDKPGSNKKPKMSQIRESGAIEQDADVVILLHRDWKSGISQDDNGHSTETQADIILEKNRNGETAVIKIKFNPETMNFYEEQPTQFPVRFDNPRAGIYPGGSKPFD